MSDYNDYEDFDDQEDGDELYSYNELIMDKRLTEEEEAQMNPIYQELPISFCWLDDPSNNYMFSVWKYMIYTYIDNFKIRYTYPMFGEEYDYMNLMAQTFYTN